MLSRIRQGENRQGRLVREQPYILRRAERVSETGLAPDAGLNAEPGLVAPDSGAAAPAGQGGVVAFGGGRVRVRLGPAVGDGVLFAAGSSVSLAQGRRERSGRALAHVGIARRIRKRRTRADRRNGSLAGLGTGGNLTRRRATGRGGAGAARLLDRGIKDSLLAGGVGLRARVAVGARPLVGAGRLGPRTSVGGRADAVGAGRGSPAVLVGQGRVAADAPRNGGSGSRETLSRGTILVDVAAALAERAFAVQRATLASDEVAAVVLRHATRAQRTVGRRLVSRPGEHGFTDGSCSESCKR